jgi:hypothetical protein
MSSAESRHQLVGCADCKFFFRGCALYNFDFFFGAFAVHPMFTISSVTDNFGQQPHPSRPSLNRD